MRVHGGSGGEISTEMIQKAIRRNRQVAMDDGKGEVRNAELELIDTNNGVMILSPQGDDPLKVKGYTVEVPKNADGLQFAFGAQPVMKGNTQAPDLPIIGFSIPGGANYNALRGTQYEHLIDSVPASSNRPLPPPSQVLPPKDQTNIRLINSAEFYHSPRESVHDGKYESYMKMHDNHRKLRRSKASRSSVSRQNPAVCGGVTPLTIGGIIASLFFRKDSTPPPPPVEKSLTHSKSARPQRSKQKGERGPVVRSPPQSAVELPPQPSNRFSKSPPNQRQYAKPTPTQPSRAPQSTTVYKGDFVPSRPSSAVTSRSTSRVTPPQSLAEPVSAPASSVELPPQPAAAAGPQAPPIQSGTEKYRVLTTDGNQHVVERMIVTPQPKIELIRHFLTPSEADRLVAAISKLEVQPVSN